MTTSYLVAHVQQHPRRHSLVTAVRALGGDPARLRLRSSSDLAFPAAEVLDVDGHELLVAPLGLGGSGSPLPSCYAEEMQAWQPDHAATGLIDLIQHRLLSLLYLALTRHRGVDDPQRYRELVSGLCGSPAADLLPFAALLAGPPTAEALSRIASARTGAPVAVFACAPLWTPVAAEDRPGLGRARLGIDTMLGTHIRAAATGFRIEVGPVPWQTVDAWRAGGSSLATLHRILAALNPDGLTSRIDLLIDTTGSPDDAWSQVRLGSGARLGGTPPRLQGETISPTNSNQG